MAHLAEPVHRLQFVLAQSFPYMPFDDLSALSRTSRVLCRLARRDLFKVVKPRKLSTAITFCESVRSHSDLGLHVRVLHFQFDLTNREEQVVFEEALLETIPLFPRLATFRWLLNLKPFIDEIWNSLKTHCPLLKTVDILTTNGIKPQSSLFQLDYLSEFRIRLWSSRLNMPPNAFLVLPLPEEIFQPTSHPLQTMLTNHSPDLTALELNIVPAYRPALPTLLKPRTVWPKLRELILSPLSNHSTAHQAFEAFVPFLVHHPTIEILRLVNCCHSVNHLPSPITFLEESHGFRGGTHIGGSSRAVLTHPRLPDDALPNLRTFEGPAIGDFLVISSPAARRPIEVLPHVEGWIKTRAQPNVNDIAGAGHVVPEDVIDVATLSSRLGGMAATLKAVSLHFHNAELDWVDLKAITTSLRGVKHLVIDAKSACAELIDSQISFQDNALRGFNQLESVTSLQIDGSFTYDLTSRQMADKVARLCPKLKTLIVFRPAKKEFESYMVRWARRKERPQTRRLAENDS